MIKKLYRLVLFLGFSTNAFAGDITVTSDISKDITWTADNEYIINKVVYVTSGATLTIEPGTTIYGTRDTANSTFGSLVITRGAKIIASGTAAKPIVFTALEERDDPTSLSLTTNKSGVA